MEKISFIKEAQKFIENWKKGEIAKNTANVSVKSRKFSEEYMRMKYGMYLKDNKK